MKYSIAGARGPIGEPEAILRKAQEWATARGAEVVLADAQSVFGGDHVQSAVRHAMRARDANTMVARTLAMEALRYLAGKRQVVDAIRIVGIRKGSAGVAVVVFGDESPDAFVAAMGWSRDDDVLGSEGKRLEILGVTETEAGTVPEGRRTDLALERVALVDVAK